MNTVGAMEKVTGGNRLRSIAIGAVVAISVVALGVLMADSEPFDYAFSQHRTTHLSLVAAGTAW
jgi:hypothetical protein